MTEPRSPSNPPHPSSPQKAWCRLGLLGLSKRHPPLVEHVACVGHKQSTQTHCGRTLGQKGEETGCLAYRARMHRFFAELEPSLSVTEQNLADRVRYILRSNIFGDAELEQLRREAVPSSDGNATAGNAAH
ncbi:unnamed protein product [Parnassius apollo]|uniref:(apollo) hypothetical protein n=1 Tax=Parnassius apollo TaxID=110799 RepID=A0A8S3W1S5_PARAO|nr:unnamed protein product [Parnassius apollo]